MGLWGGLVNSENVHVGANQLILPHMRGDLLSWWGGRQTFLPYEPRKNKAHTQARGGSLVVKAVIEQIGYFGQVMRSDVHVGYDSDIWTKLSP